ncbi:MAG TPA: tetratricopeptide repeat-containing protein [Pyrinomonadaceae bacterium]
MPEKQAETPKGTCFVVMGFGQKTDYETGRTLNLDKSYYPIKRAAKAAGLECVRADEMVHSGIIDKPLFEQLLRADVVVADLSTSNANAYYDLGVRHALRPHTTIIICEKDGPKHFPFDMGNTIVRRYEHLGQGIDFDETERIQKELTDAIVKILGQPTPPVDSPVYTSLEGLIPPVLPEGAGAEQSPAAADEVTAQLMEIADEALKERNFTAAKKALTRARARMKEANPDAPEDPYIVQQLALVTYKSKLPSAWEALKEARGLLETLNPRTTLDVETLGLWGAVHKRLWDLTSGAEHLDEAVRGYERGFYLREDYYTGINLAFLLNARAATAPARVRETRPQAEVRAEAVADFVEAERVRREVISICESVLASDSLSDDDRYWALATMAEAYLGVGDEERAQQKFEEAASISSESQLGERTRAQLDKLRELLADSPLKYVEPSAA